MIAIRLVDFILIQSQNDFKCEFIWLNNGLVMV